LQDFQRAHPTLRSGLEHHVEFWPVTVLHDREHHPPISLIDYLRVTGHRTLIGMTVEINRALVQVLKAFGGVPVDRTMLERSHALTSVVLSSKRCNGTRQPIRQPARHDAGKDVIERAVVPACSVGASDRGNALLEKYFGESVVTIDGKRVTAHHGIMPKGDEALEVADFIIQAAGAQARRGIQPNALVRRDFEVIFRSNALWSSFFAVESATVDQPR
jgi:hypothetical protein